MMTASGVVGVLERLSGAGIDAWLDGGWGVDALLGEHTRPHEDLDLIVRVADVTEMRNVLDAAGFRLVRGALDSNFVLRDPRGREIDVHPVRFDDEGNGIYRMENGEDWMYPAGGFAGHGSVSGRHVKCLTADVQMLCHATGYQQSETDFHDVRLLNSRFGTPLMPPFDDS